VLLLILTTSYIYNISPIAMPWKLLEKCIAIRNAMHHVGHYILSCLNLTQVHHSKSGWTLHATGKRRQNAPNYKNSNCGRWKLISINLPHLLYLPEATLPLFCTIKERTQMQYSPTTYKNTNPFVHSSIHIYYIF
jgi:hypothetical protein